MRIITLDTNCIYDLEEGRLDAPSIREIVRRHDNQTIEVCLVAISASEKQPQGGHIRLFTQFMQKIETLGLGNLKILKPMAYDDLAYDNYSLDADDQMRMLEQTIHGILFPAIPFSGLDCCIDTDIVKWQNKKCDVQALWSHIYYGGNVFVTRDRNFHKETKKQRLVDLGAGAIMQPAEALQMLDSTPVPSF